MTGVQRHIINTTKRKYLRRARAPVNRLLMTRRQAAEALSVSESTIIRLEDQKILTAIKLHPGDRGKTFYAVSEIEALVAARGVR